MSVIRGLTFSPDEKRLYSGGRDSVYCVWDLKTFQSIQTVPTFESIESILCIPYKNSAAICTGGEKGLVRLWDIETGKRLLEQSPENVNQHEYTHLLFDQKKNYVLGVTSDYNILFYDVLDELKRVRQIAGQNEQILDLTFVGGDESHVAVITNTEQLRVYDLETKNCDIAYGHKEIITSVFTNKQQNIILTGSKDKSAILWKWEQDQLNPCDRLVAHITFLGHADSVTAVTLPCRSATFALTGSADRTIKLWEFNLEEKIYKAKYTIQAHEKDVQSIAFAPNDKVFASSSLDKTAKVKIIEIF